MALWHGFMTWLYDGLCSQVEHSRYICWCKWADWKQKSDGVILSSLSFGPSLEVCVRIQELMDSILCNSVIGTKPGPLMLRLNALPFVLEGLISKLEGNHVVPVLGLCLVEEVMGQPQGSCTKWTELLPFQTLTWTFLPRNLVPPFLPY